VESTGGEPTSVPLPVRFDSIQVYNYNSLTGHYQYLLTHRSLRQHQSLTLE
jgi:hypothetical protein